jgi:hypothetical protein
MALDGVRSVDITVHAILSTSHVPIYILTEMNMNQAILAFF